MQSKGSHSQLYARLHMYLDVLRKLNSGSIIKLEGQPRINMDAPIEFKRVFICLYAMKSSCKNRCKSFIGIDNCRLKSLFGGTILGVIGIDANNGMVLVSWTIVNKKIGDS